MIAYNEIGSTRPRALWSSFSHHLIGIVLDWFGDTEALRDLQSLKRWVDAETHFSLRSGNFVLLPTHWDFACNNMTCEDMLNISYIIEEIETHVGEFDIIGHAGVPEGYNEPLVFLLEISDEMLCVIRGSRRSMDSIVNTWLRRRQGEEL